MLAHNSLKLAVASDPSKSRWPLPRSSLENFGAALTSPRLPELAPSRSGAGALVPTSPSAFGAGLGPSRLPFWSTVPGGIASSNWLSKYRRSRGLCRWCHGPGRLVLPCRPFCRANLPVVEVALGLLDLLLRHLLQSGLAVPFEAQGPGTRECRLACHDHGVAKILFEDLSEGEVAMFALLGFDAAPFLESPHSRRTDVVHLEEFLETLRLRRQLTVLGPRQGLFHVDNWQLCVEFGCCLAQGGRHDRHEEERKESNRDHHLFGWKWAAHRRF